MPAMQTSIRGAAESMHPHSASTTGAATPFSPAPARVHPHAHVTILCPSTAACSPAPASASTTLNPAILAPSASTTLTQQPWPVSRHHNHKPLLPCPVGMHITIGQGSQG